jgi:hypothetical protein
MRVPDALLVVEGQLVDAGGDDVAVGVTSPVRCDRARAATA